MLYINFLGPEMLILLLLFAVVFAVFFVITRASRRSKTKSITDQLEQLSRLHKEGSLSAEEFEEAKRKVLGK